eukprot:m.687361 g.687361  ORF g.687361 m.687361 type:complete len:149 (-) comp58627_c0_seq20:947-1393(-)
MPQQSTRPSASGPSRARSVAFYKRVQGTNFIVDEFRCSPETDSEYFLSHFHSDHYQGLSRSWSKPIFCSEVTGRLVYQELRVAQHLIRPMPLNSSQKVGEVEVTLIEANHCPGAVLFLFRLPSGRCHLHTGEHRPTPKCSWQSLFTDS